ncbi:GntR family transcriptional regulator [Thermodesulfobacteriota bacterium]
MKQNHRQRAYQKIKEMILFLELKPGHRIVESEISGRLKIGRTPVREALLMLENQKLVVSGNKRGFFVRNLSSKEMNEYFQIRILMEEFAIPLIVGKITSSEIRDLKKNIERATEAIKNNRSRDIIRYETQFHEILYRATKSEVFVDTISFLVDKFQWLRAIGMSADQDVKESLNDHIRILDAIIRKDDKKLKKIVKEHTQHLKKKVKIVQGLF